MKINFLVGLLTLLVLTFIIFSVLGICPFRYQYVGKGKEIIEAKLVDPISFKETYKDVPIDTTIIFDTWTGTTYASLDTLDILLTSNIRTNKWKADFFTKPTFPVPQGKEAILQERLKKLIQKVENREQEDLEKSIIKGILSK